MKPIRFEDFILFENQDYIVINKPSGVSSLDDRQPDGQRFSVLSLARAYTPDPQLCHRLDRETTGVLAIAKNPAAYRHLAMQFEHRQTIKRYHAVVGGVHGFDGEAVYMPILALPRDGLVRLDKQRGKEAETVFYTLEAFRHHTLVECIPITGRMHQIRIHLSFLKAPIVADPAYGGKDVLLSSLKRNFNLKKDTDERPLMQRVALHAHSLTFDLLDGERVRIEAPYPKDFDVLVKLLRKHAS